MKNQMIVIGVIVAVIAIGIVSFVMAKPHIDETNAANDEKTRIEDQKAYYAESSIEVNNETLAGTWTSIRGEENKYQDMILNADNTYIVKWQDSSDILEKGAYELKDKTITLTNQVSAITYDVYIQKGTDGINPADPEEKPEDTTYSLYLNNLDDGNIFYFGTRPI